MAIGGKGSRIVHRSTGSVLMGSYELDKRNSCRCPPPPTAFLSLSPTDPVHQLPSPRSLPFRRPGEARRVPGRYPFTRSPGRGECLHMNSHVISPRGEMASADMFKVVPSLVNFLCRWSDSALSFFPFVGRAFARRLNVLNCKWVCSSFGKATAQLHAAPDRLGCPLIGRWSFLAHDRLVS